jgi:hypothetical protein
MPPNGSSQDSSPPAAPPQSTSPPLGPAPDQSGVPAPDSPLRGAQPAAPPLADSPPATPPPAAPPPDDSRASRWFRNNMLFMVILLAIALWCSGMHRPCFVWSHLDAANWLKLGFLLNLAFISLLAISVGYAMSGRPAGIFIDARNKISLSRFQMVLWTILVAAAVWTAFAWNVTATSGHLPADFTIPDQLYLALGISGVTGLVGTPFLLSIKRLQSPDQQQFDTQVAQRTPSGANKAGNAGTVVTKSTPADADWSDIFRGDETGNYFATDIGKLQNFLFTIIVVASYGAALYFLFAATAASAPVGKFPDFSPTLTGFLAISHAAYLGGKALAQGK